MNCKVKIANLWMEANKLTINAAKSSALVKTPGTKTATQKPKVYYCGPPTAVTTNVWYLGLRIDENLKFNIHLKFVVRKIACTVGILNIFEMLFPQGNSIATLSYINLSSSSLCGSTYKSYLHKISILQNKAVKIITPTK